MRQQLMTTAASVALLALATSPAIAGGGGACNSPGLSLGAPTYTVTAPFPMSQAEYDNGKLDGPVGDYPASYNGQPNHIAALINQCNISYSSFGPFNCVNVIGQPYKVGPTTMFEGTYWKPYGVNNWGGACGTQSGSGAL